MSMDRETFSMVEVARVLLSLVDAPPGTDMSGMGVNEKEYLGQSVYKLYVDRDALVRMANLPSE